MIRPSDRSRPNVRARGSFFPTLPTLLIASLVAIQATAGVNVRIKDISRIAGLEGIDLIGYGIVVGLSGTGDKDIELTKTTMASLYEQFKIKLAVDDLKSKNVAAVIVTAMAKPASSASPPR